MPENIQQSRGRPFSQMAGSRDLDALTSTDCMKDCVVRRARAVEEFDERFKTNSGASTANGLAYGPTLLRNLMFTRIHEDVERTFGTDSMIMPMSESKNEMQGKAEIEIYQIAVSTDEATTQGYVSAEAGWYATWLGRLRLGDAIENEQIRQRLDRYLPMLPADRRLAFSNALVRSVPEAGCAPLVLFRMFPLAVRIATAIAFGDHSRASEVRKQQGLLLPAISDCQFCHGRPLDNGERCELCGKPALEVPLAASR